MLDALATPVGITLRAIHSALSEVFDPASGWAWGLSIVLLTVTVRLLLFPLFVKQIKSQRRMQEIAPMVKELQKKHKGDRETLNQELMKLYKENNANPISGCLPLLLQLPVFFALFTVFREFKPGAEAAYGLTAQQLEEGARAKVLGAPISAAFNSSGTLLEQLGSSATTVRLVAALLVVLMGASTFWTQRQMIARAGATDPQQVMIQKLLLYVLPLSFAVSGVFFPIGVLLYWLTTNVWSMGQQAYVIKRMPPPVMPGTSGAAPAKPARGKGSAAGGGTAAGKGADSAGPGGGTPAGQGATTDVGSTPTAGGAPAGDSSAGLATAVQPPGPRSASGPRPAGGPSGRKAAGSRKNKNRKGGRR